MSMPNWLAALLVISMLLTLNYAVWVFTDLIDRYEKTHKGIISIGDQP